MSSSALLQLAAKGIADTVLIQDPERTFFRQKWFTHTNFSREFISIQFSPDFNYGRRAQAEIVRSGDLIKSVFLHLILAKLDKTQAGFTAGEGGSTWVNEVGHAIIVEAKVIIGQTEIDRMEGELMALLQELETSNEKALGYAIGKAGMQSELEKWSDYNQELYIPMGFWFCREYADSLPLIALQNQKTIISIDVNTFPNLLFNVDNAIAATPGPVHGNILKAELIAEYIFLDTWEQGFHINTKNEYLYTYWQRQKFLGHATSGNQSYEETYPITFNQPLKEMLITVQDKARNSTPGHNSYFDYSSKADNVNNLMAHPIVDYNLVLNGNALNHPLRATFGHTILNSMHHGRIPRRHIYPLPFALDPSDRQPTGETNASRIDTKQVRITLQPEMNVDSDVSIWARGINTLSFQKGMVAPRFAC